MVAVGHAVARSRAGHRAQKDIMPPATTVPLPTMGTFCAWLQTQDHSCPASPYWQQRRAEMRTLDTAPAEVQHAICALLCPKDIAAIRLTSTVLAKIGAHYLMRKVTFHTSAASLERLLNIASHEVFRQHVETVHFEANLLANVCCQDCWERRYVRANKGSGKPELDKPKPPPHPTTVREQRLYARNVRKWEEEIVDSTFHAHHSQRDLQQQLCLQHPDLMAEIMHEFPRLQKVTFTHARCHHALSKTFQDEFGTRFGSCAPLSADTGSTGQQLRHIIAPGHKSLQGLQELVIADLDPFFFSPVGGYSIKCNAFTNLKKLDISFRLPDMVVSDFIGYSMAYKHFKEGALQRAIASANGLEELRIAFNDGADDGAAVELKHILGDTSFTCLTKLSISFVEADAESFMDILRRQKGLKQLSLECVSIKGSWPDVLDKMRTDLDLKEAEFGGFLIDDEQFYNVGVNSNFKFSRWMLVYSDLPRLSSLNPCTTDNLPQMEDAQVENYMESREEFTVASAIDMYLTDPNATIEWNPLVGFNEEYASIGALNDMWHEMMAEIGSACECEDCFDDPMDSEDFSDISDDSDDSDCDMPDLEDVRPAGSHCSGTEHVST